MRVAILHPNIDTDGRWIHDFVPKNDRYDFVLVPYAHDPKNWHERGDKTGLSEWRAHFTQVHRAMAVSPDVIVTNFPQLALAASVRTALTAKKPNIVGWSYNLGDIGNPLKGRLSGYALNRSDQLIVHSSEEIDRYAEWHGLPRDKFRFVPLQCGALNVPAADEPKPYAVAMGSAGRDYATLAEAARGFDGKIIMVAKPDAVKGIDLPDNISLRNGLTLHECYSLNAGALFSVVPISNLETASGQVTFISSMALGCPVIATECPGTRDYLTDGDGSYLIPPFDAEAMRAKMDTLWHDERTRTEMGVKAKELWQNKYSDPVAGENLLLVLDEVTGNA